MSGRQVAAAHVTVLILPLIVKSSNLIRGDVPFKGSGPWGKLRAADLIKKAKGVLNYISNVGEAHRGPV